MKKATIGIWIFHIVSLCSPLLFLLMHVPIWDGKEILLTSEFPLSIILFVMQCLALVSALVQLLFHLQRKEYPYLLSILGYALTVFSVISLCLFGYFFVLNLGNVPLIPPQR